MRLGLGRCGRLGVAVSLAGLAWHIAVLAGLSIDRAPTDAAGQGNLAHLLWFWSSAGLGWAGLTMLWIALRGAGGSGSADHGGHGEKDARHRPRWLPLVLIFAIAIAARGVVIFTHDATLSDDIHRYELDGRTLARGINPYLQSPAQCEADILLGSSERWPGERALIARVNNREMHTLYLPTSQLVFAGVGLAMGDADLDTDDSARPFRVAFIFFEIIAMICIALLLKRRGRSAWWLALYAWHPVVIAEFAGSGHQDAIGIALLLLAIVTVGPRVERGLIASMIPLAFGALVKPVTIPVAAFMLRSKPTSRWFMCGIVGAACCIALAGPLLLAHDAQPLQNVRASADRFANKWSHFGSVYEPVLGLSKVISPIEDEQIQWQKRERHEFAARLICLALLAGMFIGLMRSRLDLIAATRTLLFATVLLSTTAHPWYALWALALLPIAPSVSLWIASLTLTFGYAALVEPATWDIPAWVYVVAYLPVYAAVAWELLLAARRQSSRTRRSGGDSRV